MLVQETEHKVHRPLVHAESEHFIALRYLSSRQLLPGGESIVSVFPDDEWMHRTINWLPMTYKKQPLDKSMSLDYGTFDHKTKLLSITHVLYTWI